MLRTKNFLIENYNVSLSFLNFIIWTNKISYQKVKNKILIDEDTFINYLNSERRRIIEITEEEILKWKEVYDSGKTIKEIASIFNRCPSTISKFLKERYNINPNDYNRRLSKELKEEFNKAYQYYIINQISIESLVKKFNLEEKKGIFVNYLKRCGHKIKSLSEVSSYVDNPNFFENIDSEIKAYLLGFFAADGHIEKRKDYDSYTLRVGVHIDDCHILKLYTKYISNRTVISVPEKKNVASIAITSKKIGEDLLKLGYDNHKTYTCKSIPKLSEEMMSHFIRGYFDGDGSVMLNRRRSINRLSGYNRKFTITSYNKKILEQIVKIIGIINYDIIYVERTNFKIKGDNIEKASAYNLNVEHSEDLKRIYDYIYKNANFFFKRKKDKFSICYLTTEEIDAALQGNL